LVHYRPHIVRKPDVWLFSYNVLKKLGPI
jgi:hypothetical protein